MSDERRVPGPEVARTLRIACLQTNSGNDLTANLETLTAMAREAAAGGAKFVFSGEYALMMDGSGRSMRDNAQNSSGEPALTALAGLSREIGVWHLVGSLTLMSDDGRMFNRSLLISPEGVVVASYDKIHMFDATLPSGTVIRESSAYRPGERAVIAETPWGKLGMTVCYDLRFPQLYRALAQRGATMLAIPASFQRETGKAHWHVLLRARAIENAAFVIAPALCGDHPGKRMTYGHSLVIDPWGEVLADGGEAPGVVYAELDPAQVEKVRSMLPSLTHDRPFAPPTT
ncbi:MAG TPA: carbon-nitrogen hydrolase family protein [Burkholderiales bacterium]|nr:carbon-nitrogen hydrolase family protein [Burkholderiales bacterium]